MAKNVCAIHKCPLIAFPGGEMACWTAYTQRLIGRRIMDIALDEGAVVWIFENHRHLPLQGWAGNKKATRSPLEAEALLDLMAGLVLLEAAWDSRKGEGQLVVGEFSPHAAEPLWGVRVKTRE
jgi:hypothetical protein